VRRRVVRCQFVPVAESRGSTASSMYAGRNLWASRCTCRRNGVRDGRWLCSACGRGLLWAIVPWATWGALQSVRSIPLVAVAGGATGVALTLLLGRVLQGRSRSSSVALGLVTLPAGVFLFGALLSLLDGLLVWSGLARSLAPSVRFAPLWAGVGAVQALLIVWPLTLLLAGFAVWTTFQVRAVLAARGLA